MPALIALLIPIVLEVTNKFLEIMGVGLSAFYFASNTTPTDFGLVLASIAGAGTLLLIALRFVPEAEG